MPGGNRLVVRATRAGDADFPSALVDIGGVPHLLFWIGSVWPPPTRAVALVGARAASPYGLEMAWQLGADLARAGVAVVSGMARGIDEAAHLGALAGGGTTFAVLAASPGTAYPPQSHDLHAEILLHGAACSPFPEGAIPRPGLFLMRNRVVAGLSLGVVVVEAGPRSGAHTTAAWARRWGRFVGAVPGDVIRDTSLGTLTLLRRGAVPIGDAGHVLAEIERAAPAEACGEVTAQLLAALGTRSESPATLARRVGMSERDAAAALVLLELSGALERRPGGRYARRPEDGR
jgi:DNA processing protein